jgi:transcriptional regulator of acetoin/glycerol metabolism
MPSRGAPPPRAALQAALERRHWRIAEAAGDLGVSRTTLWRWMREHRLSR